MTIFTGFVVYALIWWVVLFAVLPLRIEKPTVKVAGEMPGAPANPHIKYKAIVTTLVSAVVWLVVYALIKSNVISFREMVQGM